MQVGDTIEIENHTYEIQRQLAAGGMGAVYEAEQIGVLGFRKRVAIKTILGEFVSDPEFAEMFIGEAKLVANLIHQNIVQMYHLGSFKLAGRPSHYIAMEMVDGINLYDFMNRHRATGVMIPAEVCAFAASRMCRALAYAHNMTDAKGVRLGIVHRDISPKNIMIDLRGVVRLTDFGVAKAQHYMRNKEGEILVGKLAYMSPEQANFEQTDGRSDLFSLGIVLWEMLTGQNLFDEGDTERALEAVRGAKKIPRPSRFNPNCPADLEKIVLKALQRQMNRRYEHAAAFGKALEEYLYHDRFGVTDDTMHAYLKRIAPDLYEAARI